MPLSDWRDGFDHADAALAPAIHDRDYLQANIAGGEGFDWFYASAPDRSAQIRTPISDDLFGAPWVFRYKGLRDWWARPHYNRLGGVPDGLVPDGANPRAWRTTGGATASDEPVTWLGGLFGKATRIVDATGNFLSMVTSDDLPIFAGETLNVFLVYKAGTAVSLRLTLDIRDAGTPRWVYATGAPGDLDWQTL